MAGLGNPLTNPSDEEEEEDADFLLEWLVAKMLSSLMIQGLEDCIALTSVRVAKCHRYGRYISV